MIWFLAVAAVAAAALALYFYSQREAARRDAAVLEEKLRGVEARLVLASGADDRFRATFQLVAAEALQPIRDTLDRLEKERISHYATIGEQVRALAVSGDALRGETARLSQALRSPNVRGRWGEMTLRRVVELAGMQRALRLHRTNLAIGR